MLAAEVSAQVTSLSEPFEPAEQIVEEIEQAHDNGELNLDQSHLQKFYAAFEPDRLMPRFRSGRPIRPLRCATPLITAYRSDREQLDAATRSELDGYVENTCPPAPAADRTYLSDSGRFLIYYSLEGDHAVPESGYSETGVPDYVRKAAFAADSSWSHLIGTLGFEDPVPSPETDPYEIHFRNFGFYGVTCSDGPERSWFVIHSNFEGFPANGHPEGNPTGSLYATIGHEFKHASQYVTNGWRGPEGELTRAWIEMDAVMIEEILFDDVNDYYNYLKTDLQESTPTSGSIFGNPSIPIPRPTPTAYAQATWMLYFSEKFGMPFWVDVWSRFIDEPEKPFLAAISESLEVLNTDLATEHVENLAWHLASGPSFSGNQYGFSEREHYPDASTRANFVTVPDSLVTPASLSPMAGHFMQIDAGYWRGRPRILLEHDHEGARVGLLGHFRDGNISYMEAPAGQLQSELTMDWEWGDLEKIGIVVANTDREQFLTYQFRVESAAPDEIALYQNQPNPFRQSTTIQFAIDSPSDVRLEIFDVLARRVVTLAEGLHLPGVHAVLFEPGELASGVYIYRLVTDRQVLSKKMMLIK